MDLYEALSMDSTSIITQVNKEDEFVEVNSYSQADKREYNLVFFSFLRRENERVFCDNLTHFCGTLGIPKRPGFYSICL